MEKDIALFDQFLEDYGMGIKEFHPHNNTNQIVTASNTKKRLATFANDVIKKAQQNRTYQPIALLAARDSDFYEFLKAYSEEKGILRTQATAAGLSKQDLERLRGMVLCKNVDENTSLTDIEYFLLNSQGYVSSIPAHHFIAANNITEPQLAAKPLIPRYRPDRGPGIFENTEASGDVRVFVNSYVPPVWKTYDGDLPDELPSEIKTLFDQVIGDMDRLYFFHFLNRMIESRNTSYLILQGTPGLGKTVMKLVFRALVGDQNYSDGKKSTLTGSFNSALQNRTLAVFDEFKYTLEEENILKEIQNGTISIEKKFRDSTSSTRIFVSMILMNNLPRDNYLSFDGRKFAPVTLSEDRLETKIPSSVIKAMTEKVDEGKEGYDVAYVAQIGRYIVKHGYRPDLFPQGEYRGPKFWALCHSSMSAWQRATVIALEKPRSFFGNQIGVMIEDALQNGTLTMERLQNEITKKQKDRAKINFPGDFSSAKGFLDLFRDTQGKKVYQTRDGNDPILGNFFISKYVDPLSSKDVAKPYSEEDDL